MDVLRIEAVKQRIMTKWLTKWNDVLIAGQHRFVLAASEYVYCIAADKWLYSVEILPPFPDTKTLSIVSMFDLN